MNSSVRRPGMSVRANSQAIMIAIIKRFRKKLEKRSARALEIQERTIANLPDQAEVAPVTDPWQEIMAD